MEVVGLARRVDVPRYQGERGARAVQVRVDRLEHARDARRVEDDDRALKPRRPRQQAAIALLLAVDRHDFAGDVTLEAALPEEFERGDEELAPGNGGLRSEHDEAPARGFERA